MARPRNNIRDAEQRREAAKNRAAALALHAWGWSAGQIGQQLYNGNTSNATREIRRALNESKEIAVEEYRARHHIMLDAMTRAQQREALSGNKEAVETTLKLMDHRARITGMNTPEMVGGDVTVLFDANLDNPGMTEAEMIVDPAR